MYATVRRCEGIDKVRSEEITRKGNDSLAPIVRELPGFAGYFLIDAGAGVLTGEHDLADALPNTPIVTAGRTSSSLTSSCSARCTTGCCSAAPHSTPTSPRASPTP